MELGMVFAVLRPWQRERDEDKLLERERGELRTMEPGEQPTTPGILALPGVVARAALERRSLCAPSAERSPRDDELPMLARPRRARGQVGPPGDTGRDTHADHLPREEREALEHLC